MRERAGSDGRLLQTGVDIACRLGQLAPRRHFDVGAVLNGSVDRARLDHHDAALRYDDAALEHESERVHDASAGQYFAAEVSALRTARHQTPRGFGSPVGASQGTARVRLAEGYRKGPRGGRLAEARRQGTARVRLTARAMRARGGRGRVEALRWVATRRHR